MSSIKGEIEPEHPGLFAFEFGKIAEYDFVYTLASTNSYKISDKFDYGSNRILTVRVIHP